MKYFEHMDALSLDEASEAAKGGARLIAGGTDLLGALKDKILPEYPAALVNLKTVPGLDAVEKTPSGVKIGANVRLAAIAADAELRAAYPALTQAAASVATPLVRTQATLGGNLCQDTRCWYYRYPDQIGGRIDCSRKGGDRCWAITGENKYHSIFGGMRVHQSACSGSCPAHVEIPQYLERVRAGDMDGAAGILLRRNPLAAVTGRVCHHFCMDGCERKSYDERVNIGQLERFVGDYILENAARLMPPPEKESGKRVALVGAGPASLSAAYYLRRAGHAVTVFDKMDEPGGMLMYAIPEYRLPRSKVRELTAALAGMGIEFRKKVDVGADIPLEELIRQYDSVFLDTGAWKQHVIGIDNEDCTLFGLDFLVEVKRWMRGKPGGNIVVVGAGNVAMDVAVTARRLGAASVTMAFRRPESELKASPEEIERAKSEGVVFRERLVPKAVLTESGAVTGMRFDAAGEDVVIPCDAVLLAVGQGVDLSYLDERLGVLTESGRISVGESQATSCPGVFAGGDAATGPSTVVAAIASGRAAACSIAEHLGHPLSEGPLPSGFARRSADCLELHDSARSPLPPADERTVDAEDDPGLSAEAAGREARRCLNCSCCSASPSDMATVLMALRAVVHTNLGTYSADELLSRAARVSDVLAPGEIVTCVELPEGKGISAYDKFRERESVDFAMVGLGTDYSVEDGVVTRASIVLGAVAPVPVRAKAAELYLVGRPVCEETADAAAELALEGAEPLRQNAYKIDIAKELIKRSILRLA